MNQRHVQTSRMHASHDGCSIYELAAEVETRETVAQSLSVIRGKLVPEEEGLRS